jgi:mannose/cellobiose epimerase-like protein (N-acyl-D-glucosamine 2-epimerase family)
LTQSPPFDPEAFATLRPWLLDHVCPYWLRRLAQPAGGFFEAMLADGEPERGRVRSTLVQARLVYTFSHAFVLSGRPDFRVAAEHGVAFLTQALRSPGGGFRRSVDGDGSPLDETNDTYDQAFALLAMAWTFRATEDAGAIGIADATYRALEQTAGDAVHGGFAEEVANGRPTGRLPRRQNPHMHLLEACLALFAATRDAAWLERSRRLVDLFKRSLVDPDTGAVIEYFAEDWSAAPGSQGPWREPGHQFEWVWLLYEYLRHSGDESVVPWADRLFEFGTRFGIEREGPLRGAIVDGVDRAGGPVAATKLLWPQTEYIKACVARAEWQRDPAARSRTQEHLALVATYFLRADGATWHNQLARDGIPIEAPTPARVLYHLFMAVAEVLRVFCS